jgi:hypothetical protein
VSQRAWHGPALDGTYTHLSEVYSDPDGETVAVVDDAEAGEVRTEGVPVPGGGAQRPDVDEDRQTRLDEWGWSA